MLVNVILVLTLVKKIAFGDNIILVENKACQDR